MKLINLFYTTTNKQITLLSSESMELVASPSLLALDEPTSGLDSTTSSKLCETLSKLASTGVNVAAVIHQPKIE